MSCMSWHKQEFPGMIVTIDGPAGTGKSTVARQLAESIGFEYLDTGAMYRMLAVQSLHRRVDLNDPQALEEVAAQAHLCFEGGAALLNGVDVSDRLRTPEVAVTASIVAQNPCVRSILVDRQREMARSLNIVCEGRDQGTVVFPNAECKFFLTAIAEIRAQRRFEELQAQGKEVIFEQLLEDQNERDHRDANREIAPLRPADDATLIDTSTMTVDEVVQQLSALVRARMSS